MRRRALLPLLLLAVCALPVAAEGHLDHPVPTITGTAPGLSTEFNSGGPDAEWSLLATIPTLNPHSDVDVFTQKGETYAAVGTLGSAANGGGQTIVRLTEGGKVSETSPAVVGNHPSASCVSDPAAALGLQHDVEVTPKGQAILNTDVPGAARQDAQLVIDATDAAGRCHDQGTAGLVDSPFGGLEIVDITDPTAPEELVLTSHIGEAHTVNVDPRRPHIAYAVTSDDVVVDDEGKRANETGTGRALDGFEVVDLRSCLTAPIGTLPAGATLEQKRALCRPQVFRYRYPSASIVQGHTNKDRIYGCHELEVYPDDRLTCASGSASILFDVSGAFDDNGTPDVFTDDRPRGTPLPCAVRDSSTTIPAFATGAKVVDCVTGADGVDLGVPGWQKIGSPSLEGVKHLGSAFHMGRESATGALTPAYPAAEDIDFSHETELTSSERLMISSDERGGGVTIGAQCTEGADLDFANGGLHAYRLDRLQSGTPKDAATAFQAYARNSKGGKAIFRAPIRTPLQGSFCTAHVFHQIPGQNRIFMGYYSQGTHVVDFTENPDGTVDFEEVGYFVPELANQWVSAAFRVEREADGRFTYYGLTGDGVVGDAGRNGVDVYKVTLPAPPAPAPRPDGGAPAKTPLSPAGGDEAGCKPTAVFTRASARRSGRGAAFSFARRGRAAVRIDVFQEARGRRTVANRLVARLTRRGSTARWDGRDRRGRPVPDGAYVARLTVRGADGRADVRRIALRRSGGRFSVRRDFHGRPSCGLVRSAKLSRSVFGGTRGAALGVAFRVADAAQVTVTVRRGGRVVKRFATRTYQPGRTIRLSLPARGTRRGEHTVTIVAKRGKRTATLRLAAFRL